MARAQLLWKLPSWIVVAVLLTACKPTLDDLTVWRTKLASPDGQWIASARTIQNGGFGSAYVSTDVYLGQKGDATDPQLILDFDCSGPVPHPYVLDNTANRGGTIDLEMHWASARHLAITYRSSPTIDFQVVKYQGVEITAQHLPEG